MQKLSKITTDIYVRSCVLHHSCVVCTPILVYWNMYIIFHSPFTRRAVLRVHHVCWTVSFTHDTHANSVYYNIYYVCIHVYTYNTHVVPRCKRLVARVRNMFLYWGLVSRSHLLQRGAGTIGPRSSTPKSFARNPHPLPRLSPTQTRVTSLVVYIQGVPPRI